MESLQLIWKINDENRGKNYEDNFDCWWWYWYWKFRTRSFGKEGYVVKRAYSGTETLLFFGK